MGYDVTPVSMTDISASAGLVEVIVERGHT